MLMRLFHGRFDAAVTFHVGLRSSWIVSRWTPSSSPRKGLDGVDLQNTLTSSLPGPLASAVRYRTLQLYFNACGAVNGFDRSAVHRPHARSAGICSPDSPNSAGPEDAD
jgi:hypothetical protein